MIEPLRRHRWAVLVGVVVVLLVVPLVMLATAGASAPPQATTTATRAPLQELCQGPVDPHGVAQVPILGVVAEIHDGPDAAYLLIGGTPQGLGYVSLCRTTDGGTAADSSGGTFGPFGPPANPLLSLERGGSTSSEYPDRLYAGLVDPTLVTRVVATQASGAIVEAKVNGAWYLIWTRTAGNLMRITAFDAAGAVVRTLEDPNGLMPPR